MIVRYSQGLFALALSLLVPQSASAKPTDSSTTGPGHTILLVGGAGGKTSSPTLNQLKTRLQSASKTETIVVFMGNYAHDGEMPGKNHHDRAAVEASLRTYAGAVRGFVDRGGKVFFLPGHEDYERRGRKSVRRLRRFLNAELSTTSTLAAEYELDVMPDADCGEPTILGLGEHIVLALFNSRWWLQDWETHARTNEGCAFHSRAQYRSAFDLVTKKYRTRRVIIAQHHPLESQGEYGGNFRAIEHLKPPIWGSFAVWAHKTGLVAQYRNHVMYDALASTLRSTADKYGSFIFAGGHDRSLQVLRMGTQMQIVSGSAGEHPTPVTTAEGDGFAESRPGWVEIQLNAVGEGQVVVVAGDSGESIHQTTLAPLPELSSGAQSPPGPMPTGPVASTYAKTNPGKTNFFQGFILGDHYRNAYALVQNFPVLNLATEAGGLKPLKIGGGNQTNSLRLEDPNHGQWALRSTSKDSSRFLPYAMNQVSFISYLLEDGFTATHPSAALAVPPMAQALGLYHTRPRLMYLPDQAALAEFRGYITDELVLLERRPKAPKVGILPAHLGGGASSVGPTKYKSTDQVLAKITDKPWKHRVDQEMMLRARLLDIFLGDWDRHRDQWRFAQIPMEDGTKLYRPIPRDRDQAMAHYDGALLFIGRMAVPNIRVLQPFSKDIGSLDWLTYNARYIDPTLLNGIDRDRWMQIAKEVQSALKDEVIAEGLASWPSAAHELHGEGVAKKLRSRRAQLVDAAARYYEKTNETVELLGSTHGDRIDMSYLNGDRIHLEFRRKKTGKDGQPYFARTFDPQYTDTIHIYALDGRDNLVVHGKPSDSIQVRFLGGAGTDSISAAPDTQGTMQADGIEVYDRPKGLKIADSIEVDDERSKSAYHNQYDRFDTHHEPLKFGGLPSFAINPDDGLYLGGTMHLVQPDFKRRPFGSSHSLRAFFATTTLGLEAGYRGTFPESLGGFDQELDLSGTTATFTRNFFGLTNQFVLIPQAGREFHQVRQSHLAASYGLIERPAGDSIRLGLRGHVRLVDVEATEGRFVVVSPDVSTDALGRRLFAGATAHGTISTIDSPTYPKRGFIAQVTSTVRTDVTPDADERLGTSATFTAAFAVHFPLTKSERFILSTRARVAGIVGDYPFYLAPTLGDRDLRAYSAEQLAGNGVFAHSTDLRIEVLRFRTGLPSAIGIAGSIDHGLAFGPDTAGGKYHAMAGGSIFWNILGTVGVSVGYYKGFREGQRLSIGVGPLFASTGTEQ